MAEKKEFTMEQVFALWKKQSKSGGSYFTGKCTQGNLVAFFNGKKKNPKEPDIRVYLTDEEGKAQSEEYVSLWVNVSKNDKKYVTGKLDGKKIVGFMNSSDNEKRPYLSVYYSDAEPKAKEEQAPSTADAI